MLSCFSSLSVSLFLRRMPTSVRWTHPPGPAAQFLLGKLLKCSSSGKTSQVRSYHFCPRPVKALQWFLILLSIKSKALLPTARPCPAQTSTSSLTFLHRHTWLIWTQPHWLTWSSLITLSSLDFRSLHLFPLPGRDSVWKPRGWAFYFLQGFQVISQWSLS